MACGLLHYPRRLPALDMLNSKRVHYRVPKIGDYGGNVVMVVGGGDSALDAAVMVLERGGEVDVVVRGDGPTGKADTLARVQEQGGRIHLQSEVVAAELFGDELVASLSSGQTLRCDLAIVQIGFLSARDTLSG